jgi:hypothetical protein
MTETFRPDRVRAPRWRSFVIAVAALIALSVYLFVKAPVPLAARPREPATVPIRTVFAMLELENDAARALWTEEIVKHGLARGLAFDEHWRNPRVDAGPLPALFLRETARNLEQSSVRLGLFLGSRFPINSANHFAGQQADAFEKLAANDGAPQFFYDPATRLHTAMFADRAVVDTCVSCHNEHPDSPKRDWKPRAIMGATTWMHPDERVSVERSVAMIEALRASIRAAYVQYLEKAATFSKRPAIGERWPKDGFYLPTADAFMRELAKRSSAGTLQGLLEPGWAEAAATVEPAVAQPAPKQTPAPTPPTLVVRSLRSTRVIVEQNGNRLMITRVPAGGAASLTAQPPLRVQLAEPDGVEVEWRGTPLPIPRSHDDPTRTGEVEVALGPPPEKS